MNVHSSISAVLVGLLLAINPSVLMAQEFPSRTIRLVVDGAVGGVNDIWARRFAQRMGESMGHSMVVDNRPGALGSIAAESVANSPPDGYTVLFGGLLPLVILPMTGGIVRYDPVRSFTPVATAITGYPLLAVTASFDAATHTELIQRARATPNGLPCATTGQASVHHFACIIFARAAGIELRPIPYKASAPALMDVASGQIPIGIGYATELEPFVKDGRIRVLAAFAPARLAKYPAAPTLDELGYASLDFRSFSGFYLPAGTPAPIVERLNAETIKAMRRPEMIEWLTAVGGIHTAMSPREFADMVHAEQLRWRKLSEETGIRAEAQ